MPCVSEKPTIQPMMMSCLQEKNGNYSVTVSTGLLGGVSLNVSETLHCNISLICLGCSTSLQVLDDCGPNLTFNNVPRGNYTLNETIVSDCGEKITTEGIVIDVGELF